MKLTADNSGPSIAILIRREKLVSLSLLRSLVLICCIWLKARSTEAVPTGSTRIMLDKELLHPASLVPWLSSLFP